MSSTKVPIKHPESENIPAKVNKAIENCLSIESKLLELAVDERSITHKVAEYLQKEFTDYEVDCEYNKDGHDEKKVLSGLDKCKKGPTIKDDDGRTVYPDIIIHKRDSSTNLVVIEAKKSPNSGRTGTYSMIVNAVGEEFAFCLMSGSTIDQEFTNPSISLFLSN